MLFVARYRLVSLRSACCCCYFEVSRYILSIAVCKIEILNFGIQLTSSMELVPWLVGYFLVKVILRLAIGGGAWDHTSLARRLLPFTLDAPQARHSRFLLRVLLLWGSSGCVNTSAHPILADSPLAVALVAGLTAPRFLSARVNPLLSPTSAAHEPKKKHRVGLFHGCHVASAYLQHQPPRASAVASTKSRSTASDSMHRSVTSMRVGAYVRSYCSGVCEQPIATHLHL